MLNVVVTVEALDGVFYVEDKNGDIKRVNLGDEILQDQKVFGDIANKDNDFLEIKTDSNEILNLTGRNNIEFDIKEISDSLKNQDNKIVLNNERVENINENSFNSIETQDVNTILDETAAGQEEISSSDSGVFDFDTRTGGSVNIVSDLREAAFSNQEIVEEDEPFVFTDEIQFTESTPEPELELEPDNVAPTIAAPSDILKESELSDDNVVTYKKSFVITEAGELSSINIDSVEISLKDGSNDVTINGEGFTISNIKITATEDGTYKVDYDITLNSNIKHDQPNDSIATDEEIIYKLPIFATDVSGDISETVEMQVTIVDDMPVVSSSSDTLDALSSHTRDFNRE